MLTQERLLTPGEAAERLAVSRRTIYDLVRDGQLGAVRVRAALRIPPGALEEYARRQLAGNGAP